MIYTGRRDDYYWLVSKSQIWLPELVLNFHPGLRLCVTAYDSGKFRLSPREIEQGWITQCDVAVSPMISPSLEIPDSDQFDEWYVCQNPSFLDHDIEVFVNYGLFTLEPPMEDTFDPAWKKIEYLVATQERFWLQLKRLNPESYIAIGDYDVIASRNQRFIEAIRDAGNAKIKR